MDMSLSLDIFKKDAAGIFFGPEGVIILQQSGKKIAYEFFAPYPMPEGGTPADDIFEIFKGREMELVAFLQKSFRDSKIDTKKVVVALSPKNLIIRFFEIPKIPQQEIVAGINFEMKKYIPFKIEELAYDFQYRIKSEASIIEVVLCGMRQEALDRYVELFKQIDLDVVAFEPALLSLFRLLSIKKMIAPQRSQIILDFDISEANILIVEKGFPYFTRDIKLKGSGGAARPREDADAVLFRLINEVRVSLDYYRRQFLKKDVDDMLIVAKKDFSSWGDHFSRELGLKVNFIAADDLFKSKESRPELLTAFGKAYGAALRRERPSLVTINLGKPREKAQAAGLGLPLVSSEVMQELVFSFLVESKTALAKGAMIGGVIFAVAYGLGFSKLFPLEKEMSAASVRQAPLLPGVDISSFDSIRASETALLEKERAMRTLVDEYAPAHKILLSLSRDIPSGVWVGDISYNSFPAALRLSCFSYSEEEKAIAENINKFISHLKSDAGLAKVFSSIEMKTYREVSTDEAVYTQFDVSCEKK